MKKAYRLSSFAQGHLVKIRDYTVAKYSVEQWERYKETLAKGLQFISENPSVGKSCNELVSDGFYFPVGKHTVYYFQDSDGLIIVAILGQSQLPQNHLK